jgi:hypothetical protein
MRGGFSLPLACSTHSRLLLLLARGVRSAQRLERACFAPNTHQLYTCFTPRPRPIHAASAPAPLLYTEFTPALYRISASLANLHDDDVGVAGEGVQAGRQAREVLEDDALPADVEQPRHVLPGASRSVKQV